MTRLLALSCAALALVCILFASTTPATAQAKPEQDKAKLASQVQALLKDNCYSCHGDPAKKAMGKIDYILDHAKLTAKLVNTKKPEDSILYKEIDEGSMPRVYDPATRKATGKKLPQEQIDLVLAWIKAGAPAWPGPLKFTEAADLRAPYTTLCEAPDGKLVCISLRADGDKSHVFDYKEWKTLDGPTPGSSTAMAYDSKRKRTVGFDVDSGLTWEFAANKWTKLAPKNSPEKRHTTHIAFDSARNVVVLYGGHAAEGEAVLSDTWEFDGKDWSAKKSATQPTVAGGGMTFDAKRKQCVLYCGGQTWLYDGKDWAQKQTANNPGSRSYPGMCFDPVNSRVLLAGKGKDGAEAHRLWAFDGSDWSELSIEGVTAPQSSAFLHYHPTFKKLFFLSGTTFTAEIK